ncbi:MAG: ATPase F0F1 [Gammaproteobacteria bacterium]|nr:ATPase F0F1 [Gammaproteobacteria bacterium]NIR43264.1 ATPase F0F1 [Gemmatimonadota bacterium]NIR96584.1 ATPase F0F1 [Gammaproteobacteria bacterium]NIT62722.1 ATPase F0F1 [Gammaproteobacteria bacterium]NIV19680.1 ATPase F0F1 [Gammaproteobacteria bacterium]
MVAERDEHRKGTEEERFRESVRRKAERRRRSRERRDERVWYWLGMFGLVGWAVAIPTLLGVAAGVWLDRRLAGEISWTLTLLFIGVAVGCLHAWYWVSQERRRHGD